MKSRDEVIRERIQRLRGELVGVSRERSDVARLRLQRVGDLVLVERSPRKEASRKPRKAAAPA